MNSNNLQNEETINSDSSTEEEQEEEQTGKEKKHKEISYTSSENMRNIQIGDPLVDIVGYIDQIESGRYVKDNKYVLSFIVNNNDGESVKLVAWNKQASKYEEQIISKTIVKIKSAAATKTEQQYNNGTLDLQLTINNNTKIKFKGKHIIQPLLIPTYNLLQVMSEIPTKTIHITGYIKTNFEIIINQSYPSKNTCYGTIAYEKQKLLIKVLQFPDDYISPFKTGEHIKALGKFQIQAKPIHFMVSTVTDIIKLDEMKLSHKELLVANNYITIPSTSASTSTHTTKKLKTNHNKNVTNKYSDSDEEES